MNKRWFRVEIYGSKVFGFSSVDGIVVDTAPIAKWMIGKTLDQIRPYILKKNAKVTEIKLK